MLKILVGLALASQQSIYPLLQRIEMLGGSNSSCCPNILDLLIFFFTVFSRHFCMASRPSIKCLNNGRSVRPPCDDVMNFCDVIVVSLLIELTTQLSKSMLNTKSDILNLKMQKLFETLTKVTSSLSCVVIKLIFIFQKFTRKTCMQKFRPP